MRSSFDGKGRSLRPLAKGEAELRRWLETLGPWVEPEALAWLDGRLERRPALPEGPFQHLLPRLGGLQPYPYQWTGAEFLARTGRAFLADEMGLGKTVQAILAAVALRRAEHPVRAVTIVCPASLRGGWQDEIRRWIGEAVTPLEGRALGRADTIRSRPRWLVTHYEQALRDLCLGEGRKAVVFSEWTDMTDCVERLCRRLRLPVFHLHGGVPIRRRPALIRSFSATKGPAVFVSTDAGGVGLNLQAADVVVNIDLPWNPARLEQRVARVHRIGSTSTVQELLMVTKDSVEERILYLHDTKRNVLANIWDKGTEDVIAAPGGSGAFREMVAALLGTRGPEVESGAPAGGAIREHRGRAPEGGVEAVPATDRSAGAGNARNGERAEPLVVDPAALLAAMGSVAPALPPEHRRSLATVFRVLAESLEA